MVKEQIVNMLSDFIQCQDCKFIGRAKEFESLHGFSPLSGADIWGFDCPKCKSIHVERLREKVILNYGKLNGKLVEDIFYADLVTTHD